MIRPDPELCPAEEYQREDAAPLGWAYALSIAGLLAVLALF